MTNSSTTSRNKNKTNRSNRLVFLNRDIFTLLKYAFSQLALGEYTFGKYNGARHSAEDLEFAVDEFGVDVRAVEDFAVCLALAVIEDFKMHFLAAEDFRI